MSEFVLANTEYGAVQGVQKRSCFGTCFDAFVGLPYATPPIGKLRFKDPLPPKPWQNVYDATQEKSCSVSESFYLKKVVGSEDCLFLNIFTKETKPKKLQPVLVYIHGGGFNAGSSSIDSLGPDHLLLADVVVVTMNYRLGALGFLSLKNKALDVPGNAALKDQLMAIKFVKKNIENFGGDPANITLFGQSAGGSSVSWHCVSEQSKGLFQKAIIMSGCVLNRFSLTPQRDWAFRLAQKLGYEGVGTDEESILNFLHEADPVEIVRVQDSLLKSDERGKISMPFAPTIEHYETDRTFINGQPLDLARKAWSNRIDILIGGTSDEGLMYLEYIRQSPALMRQLNLGNMIPSELSICGDDPLRTSFAEKLRVAYYPSGTDPTVDEMSFCAMKADQSIWHGIHRLIRCRQHAGRGGKTFLYRFAVDSPTQNHYRNVRLGDVRGVCHSDELSYLFKNKHVDDPAGDSMELQAIRSIVSLFTSFATTGNPSDNIIEADVGNVQWNPIDSLNLPFKCLNIAEGLTFVKFPGSERLKLWDEVYKQANAPLY